MSFDEESLSYAPTTCDLDKPPVEWIVMPITEWMSPNFAVEFPEIANIFNIRYMIRDNINDILTTDLLPAWEEKYKEFTV